jgi:hypothetical protein
MTDTLKNPLNEYFQIHKLRSFLIHFKVHLTEGTVFINIKLREEYCHCLFTYVSLINF